MKNFVVIGAAGYIASRHFKAIKETGNNLLAAFDISDSVGVLDSYFPRSDFFTSFELLNEFILDSKESIDYLVICSPNNLHRPHIKFGLCHEINVICEKPVVINSKDVLSLIDYEKKRSSKVSSILQLRLHPAIIELKNQIENLSEHHKVDLTYITSRGRWYINSWKFDAKRSGGLAMNIGIHFFDMLFYLFGNFLNTTVTRRSDSTIEGTSKLERADVSWLLSIDESLLPISELSANKRTYRSIKIDGVEVEFSEGFTDLHTLSYKRILDGLGFGLNDCLPSILVTEGL